MPCLDEPAPRLSWALESSERGKRQSAYRVVVALDPDRQTLCGTAGGVESAFSVDVVYGGRALPPASDCWWVVQVWDEEGEPVAVERVGAVPDRSVRMARAVDLARRRR